MDNYIQIENNGNMPFKEFKTFLTDNNFQLPNRANGITFGRYDFLTRDGENDLQCFVGFLNYYNDILNDEEREYFKLLFQCMTESICLDFYNDNDKFMRIYFYFSTEIASIVLPYNKSFADILRRYNSKEINIGFTVDELLLSCLDIQAACN